MLFYRVVIIWREAAFDLWAMWKWCTWLSSIDSLIHCDVTSSPTVSLKLNLPMSQPNNVLFELSHTTPIHLLSDYASLPSFAAWSSSCTFSVNAASNFLPQPILVFISVCSFIFGPTFERRSSNFIGHNISWRSFENTHGQIPRDSTLGILSVFF